MLLGLSALVFSLLTFNSPLFALLSSDFGLINRSLLRAPCSSVMPHPTIVPNSATSVSFISCFQIFLLVAQGLSVLSVKKSEYGIALWSFFSTFALRFGRNGKID